MDNAADIINGSFAIFLDGPAFFVGGWFADDWRQYAFESWPAVAVADGAGEN